jgi:hypothetical protein
MVNYFNKTMLSKGQVQLRQKSLADVAKVI